MIFGNEISFYASMDNSIPSFYIGPLGKTALVYGSSISNSKLSHVSLIKVLKLIDSFALYLDLGRFWIFNHMRVWLVNEKLINYKLSSWLPMTCRCCSVTQTLCTGYFDCY